MLDKKQRWRKRPDHFKNKVRPGETPQGHSRWELNKDEKSSLRKAAKKKKEDERDFFSKTEISSKKNFNSNHPQIDILRSIHASN